MRHDIVEGLATLETAAIKASAMEVPQLLDTVVAACLRGDPLRDDTLLLGMRWRRAEGRTGRDALGVSLPSTNDAPGIGPPVPARTRRGVVLGDGRRRRW